MPVTKYPPRLSLEDAIRVILSMYGDHNSREIPYDLMPTILKTKRESSFFGDKINALQKFGFVEKRPNDLLYLTDLAMQIIDPIGDEANEAKIQAFKRIDVLADLLVKYPNKLPSAEILQQSLMKSYQIPREGVRFWYDFVVDSFMALPERAESPKTEKGEVSPIPDFFATIAPQDYQFTVPLGDGGIIRVSIPQSAKARDLKKVKALIDALAVDEK
jgi:hypothetical protein